MECDICLIEWDTTTHIPRILSCGHTICQDCLILILNKSKSQNTTFTCPSCMTQHKDLREEEDVLRLIKNICLLRIVEKLETRKTIMLQSVLSSREVKISKNNEQEITEELASIDIIKDKTSFLKTKIKLVRHEIERLNDFFLSYIDEFSKANMSKIDDAYNFIKNILQFHYNTAKTMFGQCKQEQNLHIESKLTELNQIKEELNLIEEQLNLTENTDTLPCTTKSDDKGKSITLGEYPTRAGKLAYMNETLYKVNNLLNYDHELSLFQIKFGANQEIKQKIYDHLQECFDIELDFTKVQGEFPLIKHILMKDTLWQCTCGEFENVIGEITCMTCGCYRKIESYDNFLFDSSSITEQEIKEIILRRKFEKGKFMEIKNKQETDQKHFALDLKWFLRWKSFITNGCKTTKHNFPLGILPPGEVTNENLLNKEKTKLKGGIKKNTDYVKISHEMWEFFHSNYGGIAVEINLERKTSIEGKGLNRNDSDQSEGKLSLIDKDKVIMTKQFSNENEDIIATSFIEEEADSCEEKVNFSKNIF